MDMTPPRPLGESAPVSEDWFDRLPRGHRERILAEDAAYLDRWESIRRINGLAWCRPAFQLASTFTFIAGYVTGFSPGAMFASLCSGALCGWLSHRLRTGQLYSALIAVTLFLLGLAISSQLTILAFIWAPAPISVVSAWLGIRRCDLQE
jgi:hypothetical protein